MQTVYVSFETVKAPKDADAVVSAWSQDTRGWQKEVADHLKADAGQSMFTGTTFEALLSV